MIPEIGSFVIEYLAEMGELNFASWGGILTKRVSNANLGNHPNLDMGSQKGYRNQRSREGRENLSLFSSPSTKEANGGKRVCACSSIGESNGLLIRRLQVRVLPGALRASRGYVVDLILLGATLFCLGGLIVDNIDMYLGTFLESRTRGDRFC